SSTVTRPSFTFTLADADVGDTVKYQIQIDNTANFSSPVVDYTSALAAQGERTFTVGQDAGSGTYTEGSAGQSLTSGASYYWRVRTVDENEATGSWVTANDGEAAFVITAEAAAEEVVETVRDNVSTMMPIVWINGTDTRATSTNVMLTLRGIPRTTQMILSNRLDFVGAEWEPFAVTRRWNLCQGAGTRCSPGVYTVYVTYFSAPDAFPATATVSDSIRYEQGSAALFEKNLTLGHISEDVRQLQKALNSSPGTQIAPAGPGSPGKETNVFGALTKAAVIKFQKANTITPAVGYFGPLTRAKMNAMR
ncbi:MAG: peptidoglycan-binding domain-containing protein, partial [Candidatus Paceibacterota bacterium]